MRNTICATLTAITLTLCTALAGCGSASETPTPARVIAARSGDSQCSKRSSDDIQGMHRHTVRHEASGLRRLLGLPEGRPVMRLEPCERRGQGAGPMSYREIHELFVVCDECHTSLSVDDATYEDADNEAVDHGWQCDEVSRQALLPVPTGTSNVMTARPPIVARLTNSKQQGWRIDRDYPWDSLCPNHHHLSCRECLKSEIGPLHRLEYEGWQVNSSRPQRRASARNAPKHKKETK